MSLTHILGTVPVIKIIDFFLDHKGSDYTRVEIAHYADIGGADIKRDFPCLVDCNMLIETRKIGGVQLYALNAGTPIVEAIINLVGVVDLSSMDAAELEEADEAHERMMEAPPEE